MDSGGISIHEAFADLDSRYFNMSPSLIISIHEAFADLDNQSKYINDFIKISIHEAFADLDSGHHRIFS